jgi:hypothetical protein
MRVVWGRFGGLRRLVIPARWSASVLRERRAFTTAYSSDEQPRTEGATDKPLVDTFGRLHDYLRISLTERCNLRCMYLVFYSVCSNCGLVKLNTQCNVDD